VSQPLFLNDVNEPRAEFMARLTYVDHRWSDPARGYRGYESDRGRVYLRYGPPDIWASFGRGRGQQIDPVTGGGDPVGSLEGERNLIAWVYTTSELRFMFSLTPGFTRASFAGDFRSFYRQAHNIFPVRFDNVPAVAEMDTILVQFVQFRGEGTLSTELGVYTFMPIGRMARGVDAEELQLTTAAIIRDGLMQDVQRDRRDETIPGGDPEQVERRTFRFETQPGSYLLRVEALLAEARRAARSSSVLEIRAYGTDSLLLSDVLIAERVAPRDSSYRRWTDFFVIPSAGRLGPESPVALLWEIYNLEPDSAATARYTVDLRITVREVERRGLFARILGGIGDAVGLSAQGDDEVTISYDREVTVEPGGLQVEYLTVELEDAPKALYGVYITVTDHANGRSVTARRQFVVTDTPLTAR
jgi:GWxTD domain-containing protein